MSNLLWGLLLIIIGIIFGLNALDITSINIFFEGWWTLFIIIPCFIGLFNEKDKKGNIIGLIIGIFLLLASQDIISFEYVFKLLLPTILVVMGVSVIFKDKIKKEFKKIKVTNDKEYCATFSNQALDLEDFKGCDISAIFGSIKCNLKEASIKDKSVINASSIFGNIIINVPSDINVKVMSTPIFGTVENKKNNKDATKTIYVNATCLFGGVKIK
ncbi:MAG: hypothetical protein IJZ36_01440 [Bacilli bacterium]|nr:hypothetical protein [Bacilli bacterium]